MIGAVIGDIVGSRFEWCNIKTKEFELFHSKCKITDDSVMTLAVGKAFTECGGDYSRLSENAIRCMREVGKEYRYCGYGSNFGRWIFTKDPKPYDSFGNGAAMRISACQSVARSMEEVKLFSEAVTAVSHNHPEGIKGAEATAAAGFLARTGCNMAEIRDYIEKNYYKLDFTLDSIREGYTFDETCQGTVPQAIEAFLESTDFEDAIRNAVSIGGDSDTVAAITGGIAEQFYGVPAEIRAQALTYLDDRLLGILTEFERAYPCRR